MHARAYHSNTRWRTNQENATQRGRSPGRTHNDTHKHKHTHTRAPFSFAPRQSQLVVNEGTASFLEYGCTAAVLHGLLGDPAAASTNLDPATGRPRALPLAGVLRRVVVPPLGMAPGTHEGVVEVAQAEDEDPTVEVSGMCLVLVGEGGWRGRSMLVGRVHMRSVRASHHHACMHALPA